MSVKVKMQKTQLLNTTVILYQIMTLKNEL